MDQPEKELRSKIKRLEKEAARHKAAVGTALERYVTTEKELAVARNQLQRFYGDETE